MLSAPVQNQSGTGSKEAEATPLTEAGEYDSVSVGGPAEGANATDREYTLRRLRNSIKH